MILLVFFDFQGLYLVTRGGPLAGIHTLAQAS